MQWFFSRQIPLSTSKHSPSKVDHGKNQIHLISIHLEEAKGRGLGNDNSGWGIRDYNPLRIAAVIERTRRVWNHEGFWAN